MVPSESSGLLKNSPLSFRVRDRSRPVILRRPPVSASTRVFNALWAGLEGCTARMSQQRAVATAGPSILRGSFASLTRTSG
jgi:hypothetical protein